MLEGVKVLSFTHYSAGAVSSTGIGRIWEPMW